MHRLGDLIRGQVGDFGGTPPEAARGLSRLASRLAQRGVPRTSRAASFWVPGRIEVVGKQVDYAGGRSLTAAIERGMLFVCAPRDDQEVRVVDCGREQECRVILGTESEHSGIGWQIYLEAVMSRYLTNVDRNIRGVDIAMVSNLPSAAGLSSSSALVIGFFLTLWRANSPQRSPWISDDVASWPDLAAYLAAVENGHDFGALRGGRGVGTQGGSQDHTAILCARQGQLRQFAYLPTRLEREITMPSGHLFAVAVSGVHAAKTGAARVRYNRTSRLTRELVDIWNRGHNGQVADTLADVIARSSGSIQPLVDLIRQAEKNEQRQQELIDRLEHFRLESEEIVQLAADALERNDLDAFTSCVDRSQRRGCELLRNQTDETVWLAQRARQLGARAASAFGAGYGGAVWALLPESEIEDFLSRWSSDYRMKFPQHRTTSSFFSTGAAGPATEL